MINKLGRTPQGSGTHFHPQSLREGGAKPWRLKKLKKRVKFARLGNLRQLANSGRPQQRLCKQKMATREEMPVRLQAGPRAARLQDCRAAAFVSCHR